MLTMRRLLIWISLFLAIAGILAGCFSAPLSSTHSYASKAVKKETTVHKTPPAQEKLSTIGNKRYYRVKGKRYEVKVARVGQRWRGKASWYGKRFNKKKTSNGEVFDMNRLSAAHKTLPLPSYVRVTNLANGKQVVVRVNDRGPFRDNRVIDLSRRAAQDLGMRERGVANVEIEVIQVPREQYRIKYEEFFVQVASYHTPQRAQRTVHQLRSAGVDAFVAEPKSSRSKLHRVKVGPLIKSELKAVKTVLHKSGYKDYILVR